eukprot:TRINITY_DN507_c0_g1_i1.p1 TRINITY_DN507_c0_g1~~TRINITY_DN507_c0_g1_i1.p1  ORF type:complete len:816 (+),score=143.20 TRINITY_DN507_c0_g1_i1:9286-11733(+)
MWPIAEGRPNLFENLKPLRDQQLESEIPKKMSERERRLMLREMERKKRLAGISTDATPYGKVPDFVPHEPNPISEKENTMENFAMPLNGEKVTGTRPVELMDENVLGAVYENQKKAEYTGAKRETPFKKRIETEVYNQTVAGLALGSDKKESVEQKRLKQMKYKEELEEQLRLKRMADEVFQEVANRVRGKENTAVLDQIPPPSRESFPVANRVTFPTEPQNVESSLSTSIDKEREKRKKEEYRLYLEQQMQEQMAKKKQNKVYYEDYVPSSEPSTIPTPSTGRAKYREQNLDKKEQQRILQEELKKQIEEKERMKMQQKLKEREEREKEELRIQREKEELLVKHASEKAKEVIKRKHIPEQEKKLFQTSEENSLAAPIVVPEPNKLPSIHEPNTNFMHEPNMNYMQEPKVPFMHKPKANFIPEPNVLPVQEPQEIITEPMMRPSSQMSEAFAYKGNKALEEYKKQIDALMAEKLLAKEEALLYREQLNREKELKIEEMMRNCRNPAAIEGQYQANPFIETTRNNLLTIKPESRIEDNTNNNYNNSMLEKSLASEVKWVQVVEDTELYKTWNPLQFAHVVEAARNKYPPIKPEKKMVEVALQTVIEPLQTPAKFQNIIPLSTVTKKEATPSPPKQVSEDPDSTFCFLSVLQIVDYSDDSFESPDTTQEVKMTEPKFDAPEIVTRHSFSEPDSPEQKSARSKLPVQAAEEASVVVHKGEESDCLSYASIGPALQRNAPASAKKVLRPDTPAENHDKKMEQNLPGAILGYEKKKKITHIKITDLHEARKNRDKESYILVCLFYIIYIEQNGQTSGRT